VRSVWRRLQEQFTALLHSICDGDVDGIRAFDGDVNSVDDHGWSPLQYAVEHNVEASVEALCRKGADVNQRWRFFTPMTWAAHSHRVLLSMLRCLVTCGGDVNARDCRLMTPLHAAVAAGSLDKAEYLLRLDVAAVAGTMLAEASRDAEMLALVQRVQVRSVRA
jgi:hypothetical protein